MKSFVLVILVVMVTVTAVAGPVHATDADALVRQGLDLRRSHRDDEALKLFQEAYALEPALRTLVQVGLAEQALGRWAAADRHLREAMMSKQDDWVRKNRRTIEAAIETVAAHVGGLDVTGTPDGAEVRVDGELIGRLPLSRPVSVAAGRVGIEVSAPGFLSAVRAATINARELGREDFHLQPLARAAESDQNVRPRPGPFISGAPPTVEPPQPTQPEVAAGAPSAAAAPEVRRRDAAAAGGGTSVRTVAIIGSVGLAAAALAVGVFEHLKWQDKVSTFSKTPGCDPAQPQRGVEGCKQLFDDGYRAMTWAFVGYGVSVASLAAAAVLHFTAPAPAASGAQSVACAVTPGSPGFGCVLRF